MLFAYYSFSQINKEEYSGLIDSADSFYEIRKYKEANIFYSAAFKAVGDKAEVLDQYQAACSWFLGGNTDSCFIQLNIIANSATLTFAIVDKIILDETLIPLHNDNRWKRVENNFYIDSYKNLLAAQSEKRRESIYLKKTDTSLAFSLANHSENAFTYLNDPAYAFLRKKMYEKAYRFLKTSINNFSPNYIFFRNMMDYYEAVGDKDRAFIYFSRAEVVKYKRPDIIWNPSLNIDSAIKTEYQRFSKAINQKFNPPEYLITMVANSLLTKRMQENAFSLFKMNVELYPTSYTANKEMGNFYNKTGNKKLADKYNTKSLILQYKLPADFFQPDFDIEQYIITRQSGLIKLPANRPAPPEPFIDDVANQLMAIKMFEKAGKLYKMNAENYPNSFYAQKSLSNYYKAINDPVKDQEYSLKAEEVKKIYGARRNRVFPNGPVIDTTFDLTVASPSCRENCPTILIDDMHDNVTLTKGWDFISLFNLFSNDGFKVIRGRAKFSEESLAKVNVVVIAGGVLDKEESLILNNWIRNGGALLALAHHDGKDLYFEYLKSLGVQTLEIEATQDSLHGLLRDGFTNNPAYIYFSAEEKMLGSHPIIKGRNSSETVKRVQTFGSSTIIGPPGSINLLPLSKSSVDFMSIDTRVISRVPVKTKGMRSHGIAFNFGKGKVVVTDAWALKALIFEPSERGRMGMNTPGNDNKQFALNIVRWLTGYLK